jgi:exodeoxyribonuclease III
MSWNVNGIRAVLRKGDFDKFINTHKPDILCIQETKANPEQVEMDLSGYEKYWNSAERKGYSGVAIFCKKKPIKVINGIPESIYKKTGMLDADKRDASIEGRVITAEFDKFYVVCVYTPNAKEDLSRISLRKDKWDPSFLKFIKQLEKKKSVIFCGDLNVAHTEIDLARPKENNGKKGFTKEERQGFDNLLKSGFVDTLRNKYPGKEKLYTWWSHWGNARSNNVGWRIDYVCVSSGIKKNVTDAYILPKVMGSDHCPVGIKYKV